MATYAIGDIQGCYQQLIELLDKINFSEKDTLWLTGDIINRGPESLKTLRLVKQLVEQKRAILVLGNHDLGTLTIARGFQPFDPKHHTFQDILNAEDKEELLSWLEQQPLFHQDPLLGYILVHAGLYPFWDLIDAERYNAEIMDVLRGKHRNLFYQHLYGNMPKRWDPTLEGPPRWRCIVNCFTRLRFCSVEGELDFTSKGTAKNPPPGYLPWYEIPNEGLSNMRILFGHWAALEGKCEVENVFALDTGCVWGNCLTAFRLEDQQRFSVSCKDQIGTSSFA